MPAFKLVSQYLYFWPVTVRVPDPDKAGGIIEQTFEAQFEALPLEEVNAREREARKLADEGDFQARETHLLNRVVKGWKHVEEDDGSLIPFSEGAMKEAMRFPFFRAAVYRAYLDSLNGEKPRLGN